MFHGSIVSAARVVVRGGTRPSTMVMPLAARLLGAHLLWAGLVIAICTFGGTVRAEILPAEVGVLAMRESESSQQVAQHYLETRGIPAENLLLLDGAPAEEISHEVWLTTYLPAITDWVSAAERREKLRCLVTVWDVPLKIGAASRLADANGLLAWLAEQHAERRQAALKVLATVQELGGGPALPEEAGARAADFAPVVDAQFAALQQKVGSAPVGRERDALAQQYEQLVSQIGGQVALLNLSNQLGDPAQLDRQVQARRFQLQGEVLAANRALGGESMLPEGVARYAVQLSLATDLSGLLGSLRWIEEQQAHLQQNESYASFDNELALIQWPEHSLIRWLPNTLHHGFDNSLLRQLRPSYYVSRLDGPSVETTLRMIDDAAAAERDGLTGKFYLDSRGIRLGEGPRQPGSYADYDECLRELAVLLREHSDMEVVLDEGDALFAADACPDTALYCGWYSLANYVDAFTFSRGAVGYHLASAEAVSLHQPDANFWCPRLLADGVAATCGPTYEPYLVAFPRPEEFFLLLLSGRYTLAECYGRTQAFGSWVMVLLGDPLYSPFRGRCAWKLETLPVRARALIGLTEED